MPVPTPLLDAIKNDDPALTEINVNVDDADVFPLCQALATNNTLVKVRINSTTGSFKDSSVRELCYLLSQNKTIKSVMIDATFSDAWQAQILNYLKSNATLTDVAIHLKPENEKKLQEILHRNQQIHVASHLFLVKLLNGYNDLKQKMAITKLSTDSAFASLQMLIINNASYLQIMNALENLRSLKVFQDTVNLLNLKFFDDAIVSTLSLMKQMIDVCLESGMTPLHGAVSKGYMEFIDPLVKSFAANVNAADNKGETPLAYAINSLQGQQALEVVKYLLDNGADPNILSHSGYNALHVAISAGNNEMIELLKPYMRQQVNVEKYLTSRRLHYGFGAVKLHLNKQLPLLEGGIINEAVVTLSTYLDKFIASQQQTLSQNLLYNTLSNHFKAIADNTRLTPNEQFKILKQNNLLMIYSGFVGHVVGVVITATTAGKYKISIAEKGFFMSSAPYAKTDPTKRSSIQSIEVEPKDILTVLSGLHDITNKSSSDAREFIFKTIPKLVKNQWQYDQTLTQTPLKAGLCFFGNMKTLLLNEFVKVYSDYALGLQKYKEFTLFLRKELLKDYKKVADPGDPYISLCEQIIKEKEEKFMKKFGRKPGP